MKEKQDDNLKCSQNTEFTNIEYQPTSAFPLQLPEICHQQK